MGKTYICSYCGEKINSDEIETYKDKKYHSGFCLEEIKYKDKICKYVMELFGWKKVAPSIYKQMKKIKEDYPKITYKDMYQALIYFYNVKKGDKEKSHKSIGIIPYVYEEANKYFSLKEAQKENLSNAILEQTYGEKILINIKDISKKKKFIYNIEKLGLEESNGIK